MIGSKSNQYLNLPIIISFLVLVILLCSFMLTGKVEAISSVAPDSSDPGISAPYPTDVTVLNSNLRLVVARRGNGNALEAQSSWVKVYSRNPSATVVVENIGHCSGSQGDSNTIAPTTVSAFHAVMLDVNGSPKPFPSTLIATQSYTTSSCSTNRTFNLSGLIKSTQPGHTDWYMAFISVLHTGISCDPSASCGGGVNSFRVRGQGSTADIKIGYWDQGDDAFSSADPRTDASGNPTGRTAFAIQDRFSADTVYSDFVLEFSPDCALEENAHIYLKWFDDDWGAQQTNTDYEFVLREYDQDDNLVRTTTAFPRAGEDQFGVYPNPSTQGYLIKPLHRYTWTWYNVRKTNGIQIYMPFDNFNTIQECDSDRFDLKGNVTIHTAVPGIAAPGEQVTIDYAVCNTDDENDWFPDTFTRGAAHDIHITTGLELDPGIDVIDSEIKAGNCFRRDNQSVTVPATAQVGEQICARLRIWRNFGFSDGGSITWQGVDGDDDIVVDECISVTDRPYLRVFGNDATAGAKFAAETTDCDSVSVNSGRGLISTNTAPINSTTSTGAFVEYAAYAMDAIEGFGSAGAAENSLLYFANTPSHGFLDRVPPLCITRLFDSGGSGGEIYDALWDNADPGTISGTGQYSRNGPHTFPNSGTITNGQIVLLVDNEVRVRGNILNDTSPGSYGTGDNPNPPILVVIATGDILIDSAVTQINGIFITNGIIQTCVNSAGNPIDQNLRAGGPCDSPLEVNGAFIAQNIHFRRTAGGTNEAVSGTNLDRCTYVPSIGINPILNANLNGNKCVAEIFRFSPEVYLVNSLLDYGTAVKDDFDIQQMRELAPVY